jgi:hypothetical protein
MVAHRKTSGVQPLLAAGENWTQSAAKIAHARRSLPRCLIRGASNPASGTERYNDLRCRGAVWRVCFKRITLRLQTITRR